MKTGRVGCPGPISVALASPKWHREIIDQTHCTIVALVVAIVAVESFVIGEGIMRHAHEDTYDETQFLQTSFQRK